MLLISTAVFVLICAGLWFRKTIIVATRYSFFSVLIFILLLKDIFSDFITDFWKNKDELVCLSGEVAVITGGSRGIAVDVVKKLMQSDVSVIIGCRDVGAGHRLLEVIRSEDITTGSLHSYHLDLTSMRAVKKFAEEILLHHPKIHILANNAGITSLTREMTEEGLEKTFCVNYLAHFYLTHLLLPRLAETGRTSNRRARVVNVTSCVHSYPLIGDLHMQDLSLRDNYQEHLAYGQSKTAQVMFTKTLDAKLQALHVPVQVHGVHPGVVHTHMMTNNPFHMAFPWVFPLVLRTPESAARSVFYACASPRLELRGGTYITSCEVTETGGVANSESARDHLWKTSLELLRLEDFGGMSTISRAARAQAC